MRQVPSLFGFVYLCYCVSLVAVGVCQVVPLGLHGSPAYVDFVKNAPRWQATNGTLTYDESGWPQQDFDWILDSRRNKPWCGPDFDGVNDNVTGLHMMSFQGQAVLSGSASEVADAITFVNQTYDASTGTTTVGVYFTTGHWLLIITFSNTQRSGQGVNTGLTNIKLNLPGYPLDNDQLFTNDFLNIMSMLNSFTFRCFDTGINGFPIWSGASLVNNTWADRSLPTDAYWPMQNRNEGNISGLAMPWEIFIQVVLQTNTPGYFNLPIGADDDYITNFALLLKNGNNFTKPIPADMPIYIEFSNEVWNWGFSQSIYNEVKAKDNNVSSVQNYIYRLFQVSALVRQVYGDEAMGTTVRVLALWQYSTWASLHETLEWAQQKFGNPVNYYIWGIGEAPYVNPLEDGHVPYSLLDPQGVDRIMDSFYTCAGQRRQSFTAWQAVATFFGIHVVGYESGPSLVAGIEGEVSRSPRMKDFEYRYYMENFFAVGGATVNYFALGPGGPGSYGDWYLFEHWGEYDYGRLQGYLAVSGQQYPDITVGYVLPWTTGDTATIDASQYTGGNAKPGTFVGFCASCWPWPTYMNYLLRASAVGTYLLTLSGTSQSGATISIFFDNAAVKVINFPITAGNVSIPIQISTPGLHTLALQATGTGRSTFAQYGGIYFSLTSGKGTPIVPSAPLYVYTTSTNLGLALEWEPVTTATGYTVQRSTVSGGPYSTIGTAANNSYADSGLQGGIMYYYVVTAENSVGSSALSPQVQIVAAQAVTPAAPSLTVSAGLQDGGSPLGSLGQAFLQWNVVPNAQSYTVVRISGTSPSTLSPSQLATVYYDVGLTPGSSYTYNVTAVNAFGKSIPASGSITVPSSYVPGAPSNLTVTTANGIAYISWNQALWSYPEFAELFILERATSSDGQFETLEAVSTNNFADATAGTTAYCYRVWGNSSNGGKSAQPSNVACI